MRACSSSRRFRRRLAPAAESHAENAAAGLGERRLGPERLLCCRSLRALLRARLRGRTGAALSSCACRRRVREGGGGGYCSAQVAAAHEVPLPLWRNGGVGHALYEETGALNRARRSFWSWSGDWTGEGLGCSLIPLSGRRARLLAEAARAPGRRRRTGRRHNVSGGPRHRGGARPQTTAGHPTARMHAGRAVVHH